MRSSKLFLGRWCNIGLLFVVMAHVAFGDVLFEDDFSGTLAGWSTDGDVAIDTGAAALGDNGMNYSMLATTIDLTGNTYPSYWLEFDVFNGLSDNFDDFTFPDTFFASLYFTGTPDVLPLFDMDAGATYLYAGTMSASDLGAGWLHYSVEFSTEHTLLTPTFELMDFNFVDNDSVLLLDNVRLTGVVPEPASMAILGLGLLALAIRRRTRAGF